MAILLLVLVITFVVWVGFYIHDHRQSDNLLPTEPMAQSSTDSTKLTSGTDDSSLNSDLKNINSGLSQSNQNLQSANTALNDQPTTVSE